MVYDCTDMLITNATSSDFSKIHLGLPVGGCTCEEEKFISFTSIASDDLVSTALLEVLTSHTGCVYMWWTHHGLFKLEYDIAHPVPSTRWPHFSQLSLLVTSQLELRICVVYSWKRFERVIVLFKCCKKNRGKWFCRISFWLQCLICSQLLIMLALLLQWDNTIYKQNYIHSLSSSHVHLLPNIFRSILLAWLLFFNSQLG